MTKKLEWLQLPEDYEEATPEYVPREVKVPRCQACGRFTSTLYPVWSSGWPTPEIMYEAGTCCKPK